MKIIDNILNFLKYKETNEYNFILPDADSSQDDGITSSPSKLPPLEETSRESISLN